MPRVRGLGDLGSCERGAKGRYQCYDAYFVRRTARAASPFPPQRPLSITSTPQLERAEWLLCAITAMARCRTVSDLLDLAYDAMRTSLGNDRAAISLVDPACHMLVARLVTGANGKLSPHNRFVPLDGQSATVRLLADPCLRCDGPGYLYRAIPRTRSQAERGQPDDHAVEQFVVALRTAESMLGLIVIDNLTSKRRLAPADAPLLVAFAASLAASVENAQLLEERTQCGRLARGPAVARG